MKKFGAVTAGFLVVLAFPLLAIAQFDPVMNKADQPGAASAVEFATPNYPETALPFGQNHSYSVNLRGNGDALFSLRMVFSNRDEASISGVKLTFPKTPENISVYQAYREPQCVAYRQIPLRPLIESSQTGFANPPARQECIEYNEPDYLYGWGKTTYHKAKLTLAGNELKIDLPKEVRPDGNGSLLVYYLITDAAERNIFGAYNFTIETAKVEDTIQSLQMGITVDPDYYLKEAEGNINYQTKEIGLVAPDAEIFDKGRSVTNSQFDRFYNSIGQGTVVKSAASLQPNESYTSQGVYADSKWKLYSLEIMIGIGILIISLIGVIVLVFAAVKKILAGTNSSIDKPRVFNTAFLGIVFGASFGSAFLILLYTIGLYLLSSYFVQIFQFYSYNFFYPLFIILLAVISLCIYSALLFVPSIIIGIRKGIMAASATIILTIFWLIFFAVILGGIFFLFFQDRQIIYSRPALSPMNIEPDMRGATEPMTPDFIEE
jgi:hypothetical protein